MLAINDFRCMTEWRVCPCLPVVVRASALGDTLLMNTLRASLSFIYVYILSTTFLCFLEQKLIKCS